MKTSLKLLILTISVISIVGIGSLIVYSSMDSMGPQIYCDDCNKNASALSGTPVSIRQYFNYLYGGAMAGAVIGESDELSYLDSKVVQGDMAAEFFITDETTMEEMVNHINETEPWRCERCAVYVARILRDYEGGKAILEEWLRDVESK
ncbi:MAG: hypothetical protein FWG91_10650 [Lachnospiraceae bacterium]|nr:hypothetical protein [Lachnospiraceae bacterium]